MKTNYHTHTTRCNHASGTDEEYVISAIKGGYSELGFSDHSCWKYDSHFIPSIRMKYDEFDEYYQSIYELKEKYHDKISIKIGLECEYFPNYMVWLKQFIKDKKLDYIILGNHFDGSDETGVYYGRACDDNLMLIKYVDDAIEGLETGLYSYLAHPDLFMRGRNHFDDFARKETERLCCYCKEKNIPLEYNLEGMLMDDRYRCTGYPHPSFWEVAAKIGNTAIIGVDAHHNHSLEDDYYFNKAIEVLNGLKIEIIQEIPYKW